MALTKFNYNSFDVTPVASKAMGFNSGANGLTTIGPSSMILIKTLTASSSATLSFVDGTSDVVLDNTYPIYKFVFTNVHPATDDVEFQFNGSDDDSSHSYNITKTTTFYQSQQSEAGDYTSFAYLTGNDLAQGTGFQDLGRRIGNDNDQCASGELWLFNPSSTTYVKHFMSRTNNAQTISSTQYAGDCFMGGYFNTTADITAIQFKFDSGNIDAGTIKLYGIKDS